MPNTCAYCNNSFSTPGNLNRHIKTAQYCLDIRAARRARPSVVIPAPPRDPPRNPARPVVQVRGVAPVVNKVVKNIKVVRMNGKTVDMRLANKYVHSKQLGDAFNVKASEWKDFHIVSEKIREFLVDVEMVQDGVWWHPDLAIAFAQSISTKAWLQLSAAQRDR